MPESDEIAVPRAPTNSEFGERSLGERVTRMEGRLENGNTEFSGLREHIRRVERLVEENRVKPMSRMQLLSFILGPIIAFAVMFGTYVWQLAKYPDRGEFAGAVRELKDAQDRASERMYKIEQALIRQDGALGEGARDVQRLEKAITDRLDRLEKKR